MVQISLVPAMPVFSGKGKNNIFLSVSQDHIALFSTIRFSVKVFVRISNYSTELRAITIKN